MKVTCPKCNDEIPREQINIQTDVAQCMDCDIVFSVSDRIKKKEAISSNIKETPKGAWTREENNYLVIGAGTRSAIAFFLLPFTLIWSGFSLGGIYGTQIYTGHFNILLSIFGIPFLLGSILLWSLVLMSIWGKVELRLNNEGGVIFTGAGKIGFKKRFKWHEINTINENLSFVGANKSIAHIIELQGSRRIRFGRILREERRFYLLKSLQKIQQDVLSGRTIASGGYNKSL